MKAIGYFTTEKPVKNEYKNTLIDVEKKKADMLLTSIDGSLYTLFLNKEIEVEGRGVKFRSANIISVTEIMFAKLSKIYFIMTDF